MAALSCPDPGEMSARKHILVAESDPHWRDRLMESLASPLLELSGVSTGAEALAFAAREKPDLLLTELVLPDMSGLGLCRLLREDPALAHLGIVMVTTHASEIDRILAFEAGIDDFLAKPFYARELASRVGAVLRRASPSRAAPSFPELQTRGAIAIEADASSVTVGERRLDLTPREFHLLAALIRHSGRVLTRRQLITRVWGAESEHTDRVVDAHIKSIRRKLGKAKGCVETVRGVGYRFSDIAFDGP